MDFKKKYIRIRDGVGETPLIVSTEVIDFLVHNFVPERFRNHAYTNIMHGSQKFLTITEKSLLAVPYLGVPLEDYEEFFEEDVWDYLNTQEKDMVEKFYSGAEFYHKELGWLVCVGRNPINEEDIVTVCKKSEQLVEVYYKNLIPKEEYENYLKSEAIGEMMNTLGSVEGMTLTAICTKLYEAGYHVSD